MKKKLIITDISRMKENRICIFGVDENNNAIRPVIPYSGIMEDYLLDESGDILIKPFTEIEFDFICPLPKPPHTEDWKINTRYKPRVIRNLSENEIKEFLEKILDKSVKDIFGATIYENKYLKGREGKRSIGTIKVRDVIFIKYSKKENGKYEYRIKFLDIIGSIYDLPITDLTFRKYCDDLRIQKKLSTGHIGVRLRDSFNHAEVFLRVGLGRVFKEKHWLFVTGIYTSPNYLISAVDLNEEESNRRVELSRNSESKAYDVEQIRIKYPKAYARWTDEEDTLLVKEYVGGKTITQLVEIFKRKQGAIISRLMKLRIINETS